MPEVRDAIAQHPNSLNSILEFGPEAIDVFTRMFAFANDDVEKAGLDILTRRLSQLLTNEGANYLQAIRNTEIINPPSANPHEAPQALRLGGFVDGGTFEFSLNPSEQGIEGVVQVASNPQVSVPFSLKSFRNSSTKASILSEIVINSNLARQRIDELIVEGNNIARNGIFYGEPVQFTASEMKTFAENGPLTQDINGPRIVGRTFDKIILQASDGIVEITTNGVTIK